MKIITGFIAGLLILVCSTVQAQEQRSKPKPLQIGDQMPDVLLEEIINYKMPQAKFSDFKGKLVILDFWATTCAGCITLLPTLDSLQKLFGDRLVILPVYSGGNQNVGKIKAVLDKRTTLPLPSVMNDKLLYQLFPHRFISHEIWISPAGKIRAITGGEEVTKENIERMLADESFTMPEKMDDMKFDRWKPFFVNGNMGRGDNFLYRSILTDEINGIGGFSYTPTDKNNNIREFSAANCPYWQLFYKVYSMGRSLTPMNTSCVVYDTLGKSTPLNEEDLRRMNLTKKLYCYNLILPEAVYDSLFFRKYLLEDLNRFFEFEGKIEQRKVPSLVIVPKKGFKKEALLSQKGMKPKSEYTEGHGIIIKLSGVPFNTILDKLRTYPNTPPILNESGLSADLVTMELNIKWEKDGAWNNTLDLTAARAAFNKYGLDIIESGDRLVEVLVLRKKK